MRIAIKLNLASWLLTALEGHGDWAQPGMHWAPSGIKTLIDMRGENLIGMEGYCKRRLLVLLIKLHLRQRF